MLKKKKILIIDGFNVLRNGEKYKDVVGDAPNFKDWTHEILNSAREALLNDVLLMTDKNTQAVIVYDAANYKGKKYELDNNIKNIDVVFTNYGESADDRIQRLSRVYREKAMDVVVVTSDAQIQNATMNTGVVRMSSREFEIHATDNRNEINRNNSGNSTLGIKDVSQLKDFTTKSQIQNIVNKETALKLKQLRDNL